MTTWINKALAILDSSLNPIPQELNELDWKEYITPNNKKLSKHISAFANLPGGGYFVFGIENKTGKVVGFDRQQAEDIVQRLVSLARDTIFPQVSLKHTIEKYQNKAILIVHINESYDKPVHLIPGAIEDSYIRSGGTTRKASRQDIRELLQHSKKPKYIELTCTVLLTKQEVINLLDYQSIFKLLHRPIPKSDIEILQWMEDEKFIKSEQNKGYYITNMGAITAAHSLKDFDSLTRKSIRLIKYMGSNKIKTDREYPDTKGYAVGFQSLIDFAHHLLPQSEIIQKALRTETSIYPDIALRELISNAIIHQDFYVTGSGPMIEIFDDRIQISNPGKLLPTKKLDRLIGTPPESRNDKLASLETFA